MKSSSTSTCPRFIGQSAQRTIPCARVQCLPVPRGGSPGKQTLVRPVHVHNSTYFLSSLILLLLPALAVVPRRGLPQPSCKHGVGCARTSGQGGFASIGSPPSPLGPKRPTRRKSFRLNRVGRANRLGLSGREETHGGSNHHRCGHQSALHIRSSAPHAPENTWAKVLL